MKFSHIFEFLHPQLPENPYMPENLDKQIDCRASFAYFDKDGVALTAFEQELHRAAGIPFIVILNEASCSQEILFEKQRHPLLEIDHAFASARYAYPKNLVDKIVEKTGNPTFYKLAHVRPKYSVDISINIVSKKWCDDFFHIEADFLTKKKFKKGYYEIQERLGKIDVDEMIEKVKTISPLKKTMHSDDYNDVLVRAFGFERAYKLLKVM